MSELLVFHGVSEASDELMGNIDSGKVSVLIFLGLYSAFDTVDHDILLQVLG